MLASFTEVSAGSQEIFSSSDLAAPIECVIFGCYFESPWFDIYSIEAKKFVLHNIEPSSSSIMPSPSPSPSPSPAALCDCAEAANVEERRRRETSENDTSKKGRGLTQNDNMTLNELFLVLSTGVSSNTFLCCLSAALGTAVCVLIVLNIFLLLRIRRAERKFPSRTQLL